MGRVVQIKMKEKCACKGYNLDKFIQPIIFLILCEKECSGYAIIKQMSEYSIFRLGNPDATGVYRHLKTMEERGHIRAVEYMDEYQTMKKKYAITETGVECLKNWKNTLVDYRKSINELIEKIEQVEPDK